MKGQKAGEEIRGSLLSKIQWLMFFRVIVVTLLLGATAIIQLRESPFFLYVPSFYFYAFIGFTYALTLVYALLIRRIRRLELFAYVQILGDLFLITLLIYSTGGISSIFSWVYLFSIFSAGSILYRRGGLLVASASSVLYGTLLVLEYYRILLPFGSRYSSYLNQQSSYVLYLVAVNIVAFYLVSILSSYLAEQVRRKEEELKKRLIDYKQLERLNNHIVQNVLSGLITIDQEGRITSFNRMAEEITGYKFEGIYQERIETLIRGFSDWKRSIGKSGERRSRLRPSRWETRFSRKDGAQLILGFSRSALKDSEDQEIGSILIFQDLTRLREMEEHVRRADRLAAIGKMAAGIAHEIRNPLASISGSIEILKEELGNSAPNHQLMGIVLREVGRLNSLIEDFLLFVRPPSPGKEPIYMNDLIGDILEMFSHSPDCNPQIRIKKSFQDDLHVQGDAGQFRQVFWNLFTNAVQAMPGGGELGVNLRKNPSPPLPFLKGEARGEISISDTGMGIGEDEIGKIFDPFFTTKERGTGLGLSIVHSILKSYDGKIRVQSQKGSGSVFSVYFPLVEPMSADKAQSLDSNGLAIPPEISSL